MLIQEKIKKTKFSPSEQTVIDFIVEKQEQIENYSTTMIANETYTSPSILIRIAKKLNYRGWSELKKAYLEEIIYLRANFQDLNANKPFTKNDPIMTIASKITQTKIESAKDTFSLIHHDSLQQAINIMLNHDSIKVFTLSNLIYAGEEFVFKMRRIKKKVEIFPVHSMMLQEATMMTADDCAICISYTGESDGICEIARRLKEKNVPIIGITSIGENSLSRLSDVTLRLTTREKSYSKIAGFTSLESISLILDILYSCYFATDYDNHYAYKVNLARSTESRQIDNQIIQE